MTERRESETEPLVAKFTDESWLKTLKNNPLMGATLSQLGEILWTQRSDIDYTTFAPRILLLAVLSIVNSLFAIIDTVLYSHRVRSTRLPPAPVFIVGQPRSGTTLVHNLLSLDSQFVTPNTFQVGWPSSFLTMERFSSTWPLTWVLSTHRPMDNLRLAWDVPCEDEIATNVLSGGASPYMAINFMRDWRRYMPFIKFASPDSAEQFERWRSAFLYFCRKLVCNSKPGQRLLLKSPCHTGRVSVLNKLFDDTACFVFVHRDPHDIFLSSHAALVDRYIRPCAALQIFSPSDAQNYVLEQGRILHEAYMTDVKALAPDRVANIAFADLAADQCGAMKRVYEQLGMADRFEQVRPAFAAYAAEVADYKKNTFPPPTEEAIGVVNRQWAEMFRDLGYDRRQQ